MNIICPFRVAISGYGTIWFNGISNLDGYLMPNFV